MSAIFSPLIISIISPIFSILSRLWQNLGEFRFTVFKFEWPCKFFQSVRTKNYLSVPRISYHSLYILLGKHHFYHICFTYLCPYISACCQKCYYFL